MDISAVFSAVEKSFCTTTRRSRSNQFHSKDQQMLKKQSVMFSTETKWNTAPLAQVIAEFGELLRSSHLDTLTQLQEAFGVDPFSWADAQVCA